MTKKVSGSLSVGGALIVGTNAGFGVASPSYPIDNRTPNGGGFGAVFRASTDATPVARIGFAKADLSGLLFTWTITADAMTFGALVVNTSGETRPVDDNVRSLGTPGFRWSVLYAGTTTINTSDAREKTPVVPLDEAELAAARDLAAEIGLFQFLGACAEKGDGARRHIGLTVQRAIEVMERHGLDPFAFAFICHDRWAGGDRYGFRTDQLLLFLARGFDARLSALEAKTS
ncbi:hypothetical protein FHR71_005645 [Methylobacterium sp. RAS18]|nr:hypothetical protein [Methylobacterium sp. RAS18]